MLKKYYFLIILSLLLGVSCTQNRITYAEITEFSKLGSIALDYQIQDVAFESNSKTIYVAEKNKDYIWVYKDFDFINKLGGKGNNNTSFQLLSDIEVSDTGNLLALDNLQKRISIFDKNGSFRNSISLKDYSNPTKFTLGSDDLLYLYDRDDKEVIILNLLTFQEFIRFGKFEIDLPHAIKAGGNNLMITTSEYHTDFYNSLGGFIATYPELTVKDNYQNTISLHNNFIFVNGQPKTPIIIQNLALGMFLKQNNLIIFTQNEVLIYNLKY